MDVPPPRPETPPKRLDELLDAAAGHAWDALEAAREEVRRAWRDFDEGPTPGARRRLEAARRQEARAEDIHHRIQYAREGLGADPHEFVRVAFPRREAEALLLSASERATDSASALSQGGGISLASGIRRLRAATIQAARPAEAEVRDQDEGGHARAS